MFQYAAGKALALTHNTDLKLDLSWFDAISKGDTVRTYDLSCFSLPEESIATAKELKMLKNTLIPPRVVKVIKSFYPSFQKNIIVEKHFHYDPNFWESPVNGYLRGYWQSYRYFDSFSEHIRKDFTFKLPMDTKNQTLSEFISTASSISLHIRRGDYVSDANINTFHGTASLDYYYKAVEYISQSCKNPAIFIFSDDMKWVKENLTLPYPTTYIDHNTMAFEDMRLMSLCKHNIIANSSFSWWGAWLNNNPEKIVIAPKRWFNQTSIDTSDLIPDNWIRM